MRILGRLAISTWALAFILVTALAVLSVNGGYTSRASTMLCQACLGMSVLALLGFIALVAALVWTEK